jgi:hypothetical protein
MDKIWSLFSGNSNILKFLHSPVRFTKCLGVRVPLRPPRKKPWLYKFRTRPDRTWGPPSLLYNGYRIFPGDKAAEAWC